MFPMIFVPASISNRQSPFFLTPYTLHPNTEPLSFLTVAHYFTSSLVAGSRNVGRCWSVFFISLPIYTLISISQFLYSKTVQGSTTWFMPMRLQKSEWHTSAFRWLTEGSWVQHFATWQYLKIITHTLWLKSSVFQVCPWQNYIHMFTRRHIKTVNSRTSTLGNNPKVH